MQTEAVLYMLQIDLMPFIFLSLSLIGGLCEVCVHSAEEAYNLYKTCRETMKTSAGSISSR